MHFSVSDDFDYIKRYTENSFSRTEKNNLFFSVSWFDLLARHILTSAEKLVVLCVFSSDEKELLCYLPLIHGGKTSKKSLRSLSNFYTMDYGIIFADHIKPADTPDIISFLFQNFKNAPLHWHEFQLEMLNDAALLQTTRTLFHNSAAVPGPHNWVCALDKPDFETYQESLPSRLKNTLKRKTKKLEKEGEIDIRVYSTQDNLTKAIEDYNIIYAKSWKEAENYPGFIEDMIHLAAQRNYLRLGILYLQDKPVACLLMLLYGKVGMIYKLAYDPEYNNFSPGSILTLDLIHRVMETDGVTYLDYGIGNDGYKKDWMKECYTKTSLIFWNLKTVRGLCLFARHTVLTFLRNLSGK